MEHENIEINKLRKENSELNSKYSKLLTKFESMQSLSQDIEAVFVKNAELEKEKAELVQKLDEIQRRYAIVCDSKSELEQKIESLKYESKLASTRDSFKVTPKKSDLIDSQTNQMLEDAKKTISDLSNQKKLLLEENVIHKEDIQSVLLSASQHFNQKCNDINELKGLFSLKCPSGNVSTEDNSSKYQKEIKKLKRQNKDLKSIINDTVRNEEMNKSQMIMDYESAIEELKYSNKSLNDELHRYKDEGDMLKHQIDQYSKTAEDLQKQVSIAKKDAKEKFESELLDLSKRLTEANSRIKSISDINSDLENQNIELVRRIHNQEESISKNRSQFKKSKHDSNELRRQLDTLIKENESLAQIKKDLSEKVLNLENSLSIETSNHQILQTEINQAKSKNDSLMMEIRKLKECIQNKTAEYNFVLEEKNSKDKRINDTEKDLLSAQLKFKEAQTTIANLEEALKKKVSIPNISNESLFEQIPMNSFQVPDLPEELYSLVSEIARNQTLRVSLKLRHIITLLSQWYNNKVNDLIAQYSNIKNELRNTNESVARLFAQFSKVIRIEIDYSSLLSSVSAQDHLVNYFSTIQEQVSTLLSEKRNNDCNMIEINMLLHSNNPKDSLKEIQKIIQEKNNIESQNIDYQKKLKYIKKSLKRKEHEKIAYVQALEKELESRDSLINCLERQKSELKEIILSNENNFKSSQEKLFNEMAEIKSSFENQINEYEVSQKKLLQKIKTEVEKHHDLEEKLLQSQAQISRYQKASNHLSKSKNNKDDIIKELQNKLSQYQFSSSVHISNDENAKQKHYEEVITKLKKECFDLREQIQLLSSRLSDSDQEKHRIHDSNQVIVEKCARLENQIRSMQEEYERGRKLIESQSKAQLLDSEVKMNLKFDEFKRQIEAAKRDVMSTIVLAFSKYYNTNEILNDDSFNRFVINLRKKFDDLAKNNPKNM